MGIERIAFVLEPTIQAFNQREATLMTGTCTSRKGREYGLAQKCIMHRRHA